MLQSLLFKTDIMHLTCIISVLTFFSMMKETERKRLKPLQIGQILIINMIIHSWASSSISAMILPLLQCHGSIIALWVRDCMDLLRERLHVSRIAVACVITWLHFFLLFYSFLFFSFLFFFLWYVTSFRIRTNININSSINRKRIVERMIEWVI